MTNDEPGVPNTDPETIDPAGHMADLIESGAVDMELAADADRLLDELAISKKRISSTWSKSTLKNHRSDAALSLVGVTSRKRGTGVSPFHSLLPTAC